MNSRLKIKRGIAIVIILATAFSLPHNVWANDDDHALWASFEMSKKVNKKFKIGAEFEYRTTDYLKSTERFSVGINCQYKITDWLKASAGHIFIFGHNPSKAKEHYDVVNELTGEEILDGFNYEESYWEKRNRVYIAFTGECKIGRVSLSLRERLQYTRTHAEIIDEEKHRFTTNEEPVYDENGNLVFGTDGWPLMQTTTAWDPVRTEEETKKHKNNTVLRSRLTAKWDIKNCKFNPFISTELYTRIDDWRGFEKLRSRIGASYKIDKDNSIEFYYLFEKAGKKDGVNTHAIGVGYSLDL